MRIVLASGSPRRRELLSQLGYEFEVATADVDETFPAEGTAASMAIELAQKKARAVQEKIDGDALILAADTVVWHNNRPLGKPLDLADAQSMLAQLSGSTHVVATGIALLWPGGSRIDAAETEVDFESLTEQDILRYFEKGHPLDKAGAYGIQEWIGLACISSIRGSYFNVVGLPTHLVYRHIQDILQQHAAP